LTATIVEVAVFNFRMRLGFTILTLALVATGCTTRSNSRSAAQAAFLAGQNQILQQQIAAQSRSITMIGKVQYPQVAWVEGLTLVQAVATAKYVGPTEPRQIIITHEGETATLDASVLFSGTDIPLEAGDTVELRP
jgi:hypothetical protein